MSIPTKEQILDAAERLITERGIDAVSLRAITAEANVNLAAVHYHFGSKEGLIHKVFERRIRPLNQTRLELLAEAERKAGEGPLDVEVVLRALIEPAIRLSTEHERGSQLMRMCGRIYAEQSAAVQETFEDLFREVAQKFRAAFARALPELPPAEVAWRVHFAIGAMVHTLTGSEKIKRFTDGACDTADTDALVERIVRFCVAGMLTGVGEESPAAVAESTLEAVQ